MLDRDILSQSDTTAIKFAAITAVVCVVVMLGLAFTANLIG